MVGRRKVVSKIMRKIWIREVTEGRITGGRQKFYFSFEVSFYMVRKTLDQDGL